uniref:Uncharacterized protein n=1 Tax=Magallana gigas TaxID=29159 RepID=A0A8W8JB52_MAGGI
MKEQKYELTGYCDNVSTIVSRRKRQKCEENTPKSKVKADVYNFVTHHHDGPPQIVVGNPISKNPCSYDAVKDVLLQIKNDVGISNHRSWPIVGCDGLPYVIASRVIKETADLQDILLQPGLGHWEMNMAKEVIFTYALALYVFRAGIRRNNAEAIFAARLKFSPLFFGMNKTNYQKIEILDLLMRESAPKEIQDFLSKHETFSQSGHPSKGEGCDFILESKNKLIKRWLPPGGPQDKHWRQTCCNLDKLEKVTFLYI